jgi:hypothetical protein
MDAGSALGCGLDTIFVEPSTFDCSQTNGILATLNIVDITGDTATCSAGVFVADYLPPELICPENITSNCNNVVSWAPPTPSDNCGISSFISSHNSGDTFPEGSTNVFYSATDDNGNTANCNFQITVTAPLNINIVTNNTTAPGNSDGSIDISVSGGTPPYTYLWSTGLTTEDISNIPAGTYTVTVNDNTSCSVSVSATINEPSGTCPQPSGATINAGTTSAVLNWNLEPDAVATQIQYRIPPSLGGGSQGTVIAGAGNTSRQLNGLLSGSFYQLRFRHNCGPAGFSQWKFKPFSTSAIRSSEYPAIQLYPNPVNKSLHIQFVGISGTTSINIYSATGELLFTQKFHLDGDNSNRAISQVKEFPAGIYLVVIGNEENTWVEKFVKMD